MMGTAPSLNNTPSLINDSSGLVMEFPDGVLGCYARSVIGVVSLPFDVPIKIESKVLID